MTQTPDFDAAMVTETNAPGLLASFSARNAETVARTLIEVTLLVRQL